MTSTCKCCAETNFKNKESQYRDETENYSDCDEPEPDLDHVTKSTILHERKNRDFESSKHSKRKLESNYSIKQKRKFLKQRYNHLLAENDLDSFVFDNNACDKENNVDSCSSKNILVRQRSQVCVNDYKSYC